MRIDFHTDAFNSAFCGPMIERSLAWLRAALTDLGIAVDGA